MYNAWKDPKTWMVLTCIGIGACVLGVLMLILIQKYEKDQEDRKMYMKVGKELDQIRFNDLDALRAEQEQIK